MANTSPRADFDQMVDGLQNNRESANKFLEAVNQKLDTRDPKDRQLETNYLLSKLEKEGKLPQLMLNAGLGDSQSAVFRATTFNGREMRKEDVKNIAENGKNGPMKFDAATQLLMQGVVRKLGDKPTLNSYDIQRWVTNETRTGVKMDGDSVKTPISPYVNVMRQFDTPEKLKAAFGSETPSRDDIKKALDRQQEIQNVLNSVGPEALEAARKNGRMWSAEKKSAAEYLANEDNYNRVQGSKNESYKPWTRGDWVSADKIKELGKNTFKTTLESADAKDKQKVDVTNEVADLGKKIDAKYANAPEAGKPGDGKPSDAEKKLKDENDALRKKLDEQDERLKRMEALLLQMANGGKPPEQRKEEPKKEEKKEEAKKEEPKKTEVAPPPRKKEEQVDWAAKERENEQKLLEFYNKSKK